MMEDGKLYFAPRPDKVKRLQGVLEKLEDLCVEVNIWNLLISLLCFIYAFIGVEVECPLYFVNNCLIELWV